MNFHQAPSNYTEDTFVAAQFRPPRIRVPPLILRLAPPPADERALVEGRNYSGDHHRAENQEYASPRHSWQLFDCVHNGQFTAPRDALVSPIRVFLLTFLAPETVRESEPSGNHQSQGQIPIELMAVGPLGSSEPSGTTASAICRAAEGIA